MKNRHFLAYSIPRVRRKTWVLAASCALALAAIHGARAASGAGAIGRDGSHDFDFNIGTWKTHISRLQHPLTGSKSWVTLDGVVVVNRVWDGRAQIEEVEADGEGSHFEGMTLFLYNSTSRQWAMHFANSKDGTMAVPALGEFKNGRGEFFDQETYNGRSVLVRVTWSDVTANAHRFEQAFSADGGKTWEPNFIAEVTRAPDGASATAAPIGDGPTGQHDFDFQFGRWAVHMKRLKEPLTDSSTWSELDGTVAVRKLWNGRANLAEISAEGPKGKLEFLSLRLFNPQSHQWTLNFASSNSGTLSTPMVGSFKEGRGEFTDQENYNGRMIWVRFVFDKIQSGSHEDQQSFSDDHGKTWEVNWINTSKPLP